jgi:hypothetical protein
MHVRRKPHPAGQNASALHYGHWTDKNTVCREAPIRVSFSFTVSRILHLGRIGHRQGNVFDGGSTERGGEIRDEVDPGWGAWSAGSSPHRSHALQT